MGDVKISELSASGTLTGAEQIPIVQQAETRQSRVDSLFQACSNWLAGQIQTVTALWTFAQGLQTKNLTVDETSTFGGNATFNGTNNTANNQVGVQPANGTLLNLSQMRDYVSTSFKTRRAVLPVATGNSGNGGSVNRATDYVNLAVDANTVGSFSQVKLLQAVGAGFALGTGTDFNLMRRCKVMIHGAMWDTNGTPLSRIVFQLGRDNSSSNAAYLISKGMGFEIFRSGTSYVTRLFWHDDATLHYSEAVPCQDITAHTVSFIMESDNTGRLALLASNTWHQPAWPLVKLIEVANTGLGSASAPIWCGLLEAFQITEIVDPLNSGNYGWINLYAAEVEECYNQ